MIKKIQKVKMFIKSYSLKLKIYAILNLKMVNFQFLKEYRIILKLLMVSVKLVIEIDSFYKNISKIYFNYIFSFLFYRFRNLYW